MKTILITGGSGKVGFQLVNHFLALDFLVVTTTRNSKSFFSNKNDLLHTNHLSNLKVIEVDFNHEKGIEIVFDYLSNQNIQIENIIHNARSLDFLKIESDTSISKENFAGEFFIDVIFPYQLNNKILNGKNSKLKNIVFIASIYGVTAPTPSLYDDFHKSSPINYGVSKAAQIHLAKELAIRLAPNIRVNVVSLGGIKGRVDQQFLKRYQNLTPLNKMMEEEDVIGPIDFLVSDNSKNMTGHNLIVDGGWTIS